MGPLIKLIVLNVVVYAILKFVVPNIPGSAPLPASLVFLYMMLTTSGFVIFATVSAESKEAFWGPIQRFLTGENIGGLQALRYGVLILFPLLIGWQTYSSTAVSDAPPSENRTIHPAPPGEYTGLSNPVSKTPDAIQQGKGFYAAFCSPCHGGNFDGKGPAARGFNPPPANFSDPTLLDRREYRRAASIALRRPDSVSFADRLANLQQYGGERCAAIRKPDDSSGSARRIYRLVESSFKDTRCHPAGEGLLCRVLFPLPRRKLRWQGSGGQGIQSSPGQLLRSNDDRHAPGKLSLLAHQEGRCRPPDRRDAMEIRDASLGSRTS